MVAARWRVGPGDGPTVADALARAGASLRDPAAAAALSGAAAEGRAFLNARRARPADVVSPGDELAVWPARRGAPPPQVEVLARWGEILVASKPAALPTAPERRGTRSLVTELAELLGLPAPPHAASRLDVGVSGAVLCATGPRGQRHLAAMREAGRVARVYVGIAGGRLEGAGTWDAPIGAARARGGRSLPVVGGVGAKEAATRYRVIAVAGGGARAATLLRLEPVTGRMHQLRVHAAHAGAPLLGDRDRGGARAVTAASGRVVPLDRVALHALSVAVPDERGEQRAALSPVPDELRALWESLDGDGSAWEEVLSTAPEAALPPEARPGPR
ncbi:RluA family pseudouridine synthase [Sorangium sp. So ce131]|uniref:RluA family pseudouridine synthase n=1 Tax=Sorangium sp. So ce131 TaxID=3133282 RepID=UPI003F60495D